MLIHQTKTDAFQKGILQKDTKVLTKLKTNHFVTELLRKIN